MRGPVLPLVPQRRWPERRRQHTKASQTLQQSLGPWTTFWRPAFILSLSEDSGLSSMSLKIDVWTKYYFNISFCLLTLLNLVSSENPLSSGWILTMVTVCLNPYLPMCSLKIRSPCLVDWGKSKNIPFLPKFFFVLIIWIVSIALQLGSIHCLRGTVECYCCTKSHIHVLLSCHVTCNWGRCRWQDWTWFPSKINVMSPRQHF